MQACDPAPFGRSERTFAGIPAMTVQFDFESIREVQSALAAHPVYDAVRSVEDLQVFMSHHVYSVWDFMSLIKFLQSEVAPARVPWVPRNNGDVRYFINQLVLEEESDQAPPGAAASTHLSHFELYCGAMGEIGADAQAPLRFVELVKSAGLDAALLSGDVPEPSKTFTRRTFDFIGSNKAHVAAAALALGREHVIPDMFRAFLHGMGITAADAPTFHYYLERHIHLDEDFHAPLSIRMVEALCENDPLRLREAEQAARDALTARIRFWDGVVDAIQARCAAVASLPA